MGQYRHNPDGLFYEKQQVTFLKRRVVLWETTGHFLKTTACFMKNDESFWGWVNVDFRHHKASVNLQCDTCDSKKTILRLEGAHMCTHSCARVCTREGTFRPPPFKIIIPYSYFFHFAQDRAANSPYFCEKNDNYIYLCFWYLKVTKMRVRGFCCAVFCDFFPLSPFISPYTYRAILLRCRLLHPTNQCAISTSLLTDKPVFSYSLPPS